MAAYAKDQLIALMFPAVGDSSLCQMATQTAAIRPLVDQFCSRQWQSMPEGCTEFAAEFRRRYNAGERPYVGAPGSKAIGPRAEDEPGFCLDCGACYDEDDDPCGTYCPHCGATT